MNENARSVPTEAAMRAAGNINEDEMIRIGDFAAAIDRETALPELIEALKAILEHVEDLNVERRGLQCTLCHTYRIKGHAALAKAGVQA